ncbi:MAG: leucine--tRNA ligase [Candidatus Pelagibacter sp. TMED166]|nr:MAG: leucine--tRNA ligase [Candidatus Pelagibacter sp. TMED166]
MDFDYKKIEKKWQKFWDDNSTQNLNDSDKKFYCLTMFSYPSGSNLHVGHWYNYGPTDSYARFMKMNGYNVFQPQGFDSFGLPAENYAIKHGIHPRESTNSNIATMKKQLKSIGGMFDWNCEIRTSDESYYKWNQWIFSKLYDSGLAYQKEALVNWDPVDQTVLANEQVLSDGTSERSGAKVIQKPLKQWFFKITDYADELLNFENLNWPKKTISMQKNWIGKSVGSSIYFEIDGYKDKIEVFTTRPDTIFGATYLVLSPEHDLTKKISNNNSKIIKYIEDSSSKNDLQRLDLNKDKTGVFTGAYAINPANKKKIPIWIADYVLVSYGTGAIMAVPGHDQRDFEFATKYNINIDMVVSKSKDMKTNSEPLFEEGFCINSDFLDGLTTSEAKVKIISWLEENGFGKKEVNFRLRDWLISRQRYWGTPIPIVYDPEGKPHLVPEEHLPWKLPDDVEYKPKGTSPLGSSKELAQRTESIFGKGWKPEIDTMDTFVCSSWYYLRYLDSTNTNEAFSKDILNWMPVDCYVGGAEHATMHLLYARFITKALRDLKLVNFDEPFKKLYHQGTITKDGAKMSKSKGNTVAPDKFIEQYGSDTFRIYLMFMGPYDEGGDWNDKGIKGIFRFLNKIWKLIHLPDESSISKESEVLMHQTIKIVTDDLCKMKFNTSISRLMELVNSVSGKNSINILFKKNLILMLAPLAPHIAEELWIIIGNKNSIFNEKWPKYNPLKLQSDEMKLVVQVNGKVRANISLPKNSTKDDVLLKCKELENVSKYLINTDLIKEIYVPEKIVNIVVKPK